MPAALARGRGSRRHELIVWCWSLLLGVLMLGPALGRGFILRYDMVWVPDLALRSDALGLGSALPRAVPSDAVVAVLDELVPGELLQKIVLLGALVGAGVGAAALTRTHGLAARLVAASVYVWNPYVVERLLIGHWTVLLGYAALPWIVVLTTRWNTRESMFPPWPLLVVLPFACLSIGAGLVSALVVLVFVAVGSGPRVRRCAVAVVLVIAANAPWLVAGLLHGSGAQSDPLGAHLFALRGEGFLPAPLTALGLGGLWNSEVMPGSRGGVLAVVSLMALGALALVGAFRLWRVSGAGVAGEQPSFAGLAFCWAVGWGVACWTALAPGSVGWIADHLPGGGVLRDGSRFLALCAPALAVTVAVGAAVLLEALQRLGRDTSSAPEQVGDSTARLWVVNAGLLMVMPVALLPDAVWGVGGQLDPVPFPKVYSDVREAVGDADGGLVLVLPFSNYRAPEWNRGVKVLDPVSRVVSARPVHSDELVVSGRTIEGEDPLGVRVQAALAEPDAQTATAALADLGISRVTLEAGAPGPWRRPNGELLLDTAAWQVFAVDGHAPLTRPSMPQTIAVSGAWIAYGGLVGLGVLGCFQSVRRRHVTRDTKTW